MIEYETKAVDGLATDSVFAGEPTPQLDAAWHNLLARMGPSFSLLLSLRLINADINIRLSSTEMQRLNQTSLALSDGSGHLGTLGVYHELHCLVSMNVSRKRAP